VSDTVVSDTSSTPALDLDVAGRAIVTESGIEIVSAPEGVTFELLPADYPSKLIPDDDKFALENSPAGSMGCSFGVAKGVQLEKPLYVQVTSSGGSLYWRMVVIAEAGSRFSLIGTSRSVAPDTVAYTNAVVELFVEPAAKIEYVSAAEPLSGDVAFGRHKAWLERDSELDWVTADSGRSAARCGSRTTSPAPAPRRASPAPTSPTVISTHRLRHVSGSTSLRTPRATSPSRARLRERASAVWRGMIRVEETRSRRTRTRRTATCCSPTRRMRTRSQGSRSWRTDVLLHARRDPRQGQS